MQKVFGFLVVKIQAIIKPLNKAQGTRYKAQGIRNKAQACVAKFGTQESHKM